LFLTVSCLYGQTNNYTYDENGNRTSRSLIVKRLGTKSLNLPIAGKEEFPVDSLDNEKVITTEGELNVNVYPNPNKGLIKIDILNMPINAKTEAKLYDLSGTNLMIRKNFDSHYEMDISHFKDGIYILRIQINGSLFNWKVMKKN